MTKPFDGDVDDEDEASKPLGDDVFMKKKK